LSDTSALLTRRTNSGHVRKCPKCPDVRDPPCKTPAGTKTFTAEKIAAAERRARPADFFRRAPDLRSETCPDPITMIVASGSNGSR
jgi:hypothetical protein